MLHKTRHRLRLLIALIASLSGLLTGCASPFERFYKPAATRHGTSVTSPATPLFAWSQDPNGDGKKLAQEGYLLIGTSSFQSPLQLLVPNCSVLPPDSSLDSYRFNEPGFEQFHIWASAGAPGWTECGAFEAGQAFAQGKKVGAAVVLLNVQVDRWGISRNFASYWAKANDP